MTRRSLWLAVVLLALAPFSGSGAHPDFFRIEDIRPGLRGVGLTCFQGTRPEEFQVEILGVMRGVTPGADSVLARFSGGVIDRYGIFEGMSGSPVYIDGKLLGAVAYTYSFAREPIAGITPIAHMVDAFEEKGGSARPQKSRLWDTALPLAAAGGGGLEFTIVRGGNTPPGARDAHTLLPIATPLSLGGFHPGTLAAFAPRFRDAGMTLLQGSGAPAEDAPGDSPPFEPGSNIVVALVRGDLDISAGGTVTWVDGNRLYAFGHNLLELGATELPMHRASVVTIFPSLQSSFKILAAGRAVGAIRQDRGMGIYGIVGERARTVPVRIGLLSSRGARKEYRFDLARDSMLTPVLLNMVVYNTITASERAQGEATIGVEGKIGIRNEDTVRIAGRYSSRSEAVQNAALSVAVPVNYLMTTEAPGLDLESVDLEISVLEEDRGARLESIGLDRREVKAGETVELTMTAQRVNGAVIRDVRTIKIPATASPGSLTLTLADGATLTTLDQKQDGGVSTPRSSGRLIGFLNRMRRNDRLYLRFSRRAPGAVMRGEGMPGLPPSILSALQSDRKSGGLAEIRSAPLAEYELPALDDVIAGSRSMTIEIKP
ncbi:MAG: SpoIVB peptidase S55 domain-containing protein [Acidobacteriota bacterium]|jgi:hypothetical protein|nr:SpoIVB peptidase S55 domain-containing protein [Acidobacteriota bacterium]NLT33408.1 hypothetical protein [Acidobacteriota bacterium]